MNFFETLATGMVENWVYWIVSLIIVVAAVIDGIQLKVPNWITFPMIISGWIYSSIAFHVAGDLWYVGLGWSLLGTVVGLALLMPAYAIGGMGAGDVKLLAGIGAWVLTVHTAWAFAWTVVIGAIMAVIMVLIQKKWRKHSDQFMFILSEIMTVKNPETLAKIAAERKPTMMLLPYGIPMAIGTVLYFGWTGLLI